MNLINRPTARAKEQCWKIDVFRILKILMSHDCSILFLGTETFLVRVDVAQACIKFMAEHVDNVFIHQSPED